jgi:hypothetical protein
MLAGLLPGELEELADSWRTAKIVAYCDILIISKFTIEIALDPRSKADPGHYDAGERFRV